MFILQLLVWIVGLLFSYGISIVYLFRPKSSSGDVELKTRQMKERFAQMIGASDTDRKSIRKSR